jgi:carbon storage regulator CsrA
MLVLSRKMGETIHIGDDIRITVAAFQGNRVRIAIDAPEEVLVLRGELASWKANQADISPQLATAAAGKVATE